MHTHNIFDNQKVGVIGLGIEGRDIINYLLKFTSNITLLDKKPESELDFTGIDKTKIKIITGENYLSALESYDYLIRSPGIYRYSKELIQAEKEGVKITSAVKIFFSECKAKTIGVTGTKGKGTTSTLIYELIKNSGTKVYLAGNIGKPYLELLPILTENDWVVMELSSFQLIDLGKAPNISVVLNITEDHMDWHKDIGEYVDAKRNIVLNQTENDFAVINAEYTASKNFAKNIKSKVVFFSKKTLELPYKEGLLLKGKHNLENIAAAVEVAKLLKIPEVKILETVKKFPGLEHRLEVVGNVNGKMFYNDSFATGPQPTIAAIESFKEPATFILGGSDKGLDYKELGKVVSSKKNVKNIILIGVIREQIKNSLLNAKYKGNIYDLGTSAMDIVVNKADEVTPYGGVIVLSPAAASFDMFLNYKDRGVKFKNAVSNLKLGAN